MQGKNDDELLTVKELAAELKVSVSTVQHWVTDGRGPKRIRVGRHVRYRRSDLNEWLQENYA
ncbi:MAG: helix-turn-helix domain-containing protein [Pseudonocardia sp.]|nr:helix-turn-helix domain-containing protein [Pseudonocardia sp.]